MIASTTSGLESARASAGLVIVSSSTSAAPSVSSARWIARITEGFSSARMTASSALRSAASSIPVAPATARTPRAPAPSSRGSGARLGGRSRSAGEVTTRVYARVRACDDLFVRTAVISDLHLGAGSGVDLLRHEPIVELLAPALTGVDRLVLLGDVIELRDRPLKREPRPRRAGAGGDRRGRRRRRGRDRPRQPRPPADRAVARPAGARGPGGPRARAARRAPGRGVRRARRPHGQARGAIRVPRDLARRRRLRDARPLPRPPPDDPDAGAARDRDGRADPRDRPGRPRSARPAAGAPRAAGRLRAGRRPRLLVPVRARSGDGRRAAGRRRSVGAGLEDALGR